MYTHTATEARISIHAPARGATDKDNLEASKDINFNPRSREGSDAANIKALLNSVGFQSTLPRGERLKADSDMLERNTISIHAPARGATL